MSEKLLKNKKQHFFLTNFNENPILFFQELFFFFQVSPEWSLYMNNDGKVCQMPKAKDFQDAWITKID